MNWLITAPPVIRLEVIDLLESNMEHLEGMFNVYTVHRLDATNLVAGQWHWRQRNDILNIGNKSISFKVLHM